MFYRILHDKKGENKRGYDSVFPSPATSIKPVPPIVIFFIEIGVAQTNWWKAMQRRILNLLA